MFLTAAVVRAGGGQTEQSTLVAVHCTTWHNIHHYEKTCTGMNSFRNRMNMFQTGMKTLQIGTGI